MKGRLKETASWTTGRQVHMLLQEKLVIGASLIPSRAAFRFPHCRTGSDLGKCLPRSSVLLATTPAEIVAIWRVLTPLVRKVPSQGRPPAKQKKPRRRPGAEQDTKQVNMMNGDKKAQAEDKAARLPAK